MLLFFLRWWCVFATPVPIEFASFHYCPTSVVLFLYDHALHQLHEATNYLISCSLRAICLSGKKYCENWRLVEGLSQSPMFPVLCACLEYPALNEYTAATHRIHPCTLQAWSIGSGGCPGRSKLARSGVTSAESSSRRSHTARSSRA